MKYLKVMMVDKVDNHICTYANMCKNGARLPAVKAAKIIFSNESQLQSDYSPSDAWYVISCSDDSDTSLEGILAVLSEEQMLDEKFKEEQRRKLKQIEYSVQNHIDNVARTKGYDNMLSLVSYKDSTNQVFSLEAAAGIVWRDQVWTHVYQLFNEIMHTNKEIPNPSTVINQLPTIQW